MATVLELTVMTGGQAGKKLTVSSRLTKIGSSLRSDLVLQERQIQPQHAEIHQMLDRYFLVPMTPRGQGVSLNGMPLDGRSRLKAGDIVTLGSTSYRVSLVEQIDNGSAAMRPGNNVPRLGEYFVRRGIMSGDQISRTAKRQVELQRDGRQIAFGQLAYELGYVNRTQLETVLNEQRNDFNERFRD